MNDNANEVISFYIRSPWGQKKLARCMVQRALNPVEPGKPVIPVTLEPLTRLEVIATPLYEQAQHIKQNIQSIFLRVFLNIDNRSHR